MPPCSDALLLVLALTLALVFRGTQLFWAFAGALAAATLRSGASSPQNSPKGHRIVAAGW